MLLNRSLLLFAQVFLSEYSQFSMLSISFLLQELVGIYFRFRLLFEMYSSSVSYSLSMP